MKICLLKNAKKQQKVAIFRKTLKLSELDLFAFF